MSEREHMAVYILASKDISKELGLDFIFLKFKDADKVVEMLKEQPEQKFFVDFDGKMTPLPIQKHGHWKGFTQSRYFGNDDDGEPIFRDGYFYVCSECRRKTVVKTQFCPRCGAKMDEEVKTDA